MNLPSFVPCRFIIVSSVLLVLTSTASSVHAERVSFEGSEASDMTLNIIPGEHVALLVKDILVCPSVTGFFEIYAYGITGKRKRIHSGPFQGTLKGQMDIHKNGYAIKGLSTETGHAVAVDAHIKTSNTLDITYHFSALSYNEYVTIDILKLVGDIFKGAKVEAYPKKDGDIQYLPERPDTIDNRFLLKGKNKIILKSLFLDVEIIDLNNRQSIKLADFRNVQWDSYKSFYVYADTKSWGHSKTPKFAHRIVLKPKRLAGTGLIGTQTFEPIGDVAAAKADDGSGMSHRTDTRIEAWPRDAASAQEFDNPSVYAIPPKFVQSRTGHMRLDKDSSLVVGIEKETFSGTVVDELERQTGLRLNVVSKLRGEISGKIVVSIQEKVPHGSKALPPEGFEIVVDSTSANIEGADARGCLYGMWALLQMLVKQGNHWQVPCGIYRDWPHLPQRGICVEMLPPFQTDVNLFKRYLLAYSKARANLVVFYHYPEHILTWKKGRANKNWSKEQMKAVRDYAASLEMEVWAGMCHKFRPEAHPELPIKAGTNIYNPFDKSAYEYVYALYEELVSTYTPTTVLIGHDEILGLRDYTMNSGYTTAQAMAASIQKTAAWLRARDIGAAIWGDMLLDHAKWNASLGAANSSRPILRSGATHEAIDAIPRDIKIIDWHYQIKPEYESLAYFSGKGFDVYGCGWYAPEGAKHMAASAVRYHSKGVMGTDWGFWRTLSPAATTLYNTICGWNSRCTVDNTKDVLSLAADLGVPLLTDLFAQIPVPIQSACNASTYDQGKTDGNGVFNVGAFIDLRSFPTGDLSFGPNRFRVLPHEEGETLNCIVVGSGSPFKQNPTHEILMPVQDEPFDSVSILHTLLHHEPQYSSRKLGAYQFEYVDGTRIQADIIEGYNISDVRLSVGLRRNDWSFNRHPEILAGSECVWQGQSVSGMPLNVQMLTFRNPLPGKALKNIRLHSNDGKNDYRIAVLGITLLQGIN